MTINQLPERLRNIQGLQMVSDMQDVEIIHVSEQKMRVLEVVLLPLLDRKENA